MIRRLPVVLGALIALGALAPMTAIGQEATPEPATGTLDRTDTRYVIPFGPDGLNAGLSVAAEERGSCLGDSLAALERPDAFDCSGESGQLYDPCFENPYAMPDAPGELACVASPFASEVVLLTVDAPLAREKDDPSAAGPFAPWDLPWALELATGDRCTLLHGTLTLLAGQVVYYGCEQNGAVLGVVDHTQPVWTVSYLADGAVASRLVAVTAAWS